MRDVAEARARSGAYSHFEPAFLELGEPGLAVAAARLASHEIHKSVVLPYFPTLGHPPGTRFAPSAARNCAEIQGLTHLQRTAAGRPSSVRAILLDRIISLK